MRVFILLLTFLLVFGLSSAFGAPTTLYLSTGLDSSGNIITSDLGCDAHWVLEPGSGTTAACADNAAQVVMPGDGDSYFSADGGNWVANDSNSLWITSDASTYANGGTPYPVYEVRFYLTDTTGASFTGS